MTETVEQVERCIHDLMGLVLKDLPAIGKDSKAPAVMGGYAFRGIDGVLNALNPILSKYGVFYVPYAIEERIDSVRKTAKGNDLFVTCLKVKYRFYGPTGDYVECEVWGEGSDSGDKATQKALTGAQKYMLFQVFCISTEEAASMDIDRGGEVDTTAAKSPLEERREAFFASGAELPEGWKTYEEFDEAHQIVKEGMGTLTTEQRDLLRDWRATHGISIPMTADEMQSFLRVVKMVRKGESIESESAEYAPAEAP